MYVSFPSKEFLPFVGSNFHLFLVIFISFWAICDMIKGNESDVGNIDFELQAKKGDKFLCFTLFLSRLRLA